MPLSPALFLFNFLLLFLFGFHPNINGRNNEGPLFTVKGKKLMGKNVKFMKAIVSNIRFTITFID